MLKSSFKPAKIVYFSVKVPAQDEIEEKEIESTCFNLKSKDETNSEWRVICNLRDSGGAQVSLYLLRSIKYPVPIFEMEFTVSLVSTTIEESFSTEKISVSQEDLKNTTKFGRKIFISHEELFSKPSYYFPDDHLHFKVKIFVKHDFSVFVDESKIILGHYSYLFDTMKRSDFTIGTSDGEKLEAHKAILAARSEVFDVMLTVDMEEKRENSVVIEDFDSNVLRELLRFIYCEHVENIEKLDIELYKVAEKYAIERLPELCLDSIYNRIDETNVVEIAAFAEVYDGRKPLNDLFMSCVLIIEAKYSIVSASEEWKNLDDKVRIKILDIIAKRAEPTQATREISF